MDDIALYQKVVASYGGKIGKSSAELLAFLKGRRVPQSMVDALTPYILEDSIIVGAVAIFREEGWLAENADGYIPIALRDGLLIVGGCPNGDPVAVDVRDRLGDTGFISHETMWQQASVRDVFIAVAAGLGEFVAGLDAGVLPEDYDEAKHRAGRA